ncbi:unnamed protein product [Symbiodinium natans]|uniref:Uncharacterized protein n=1 Tax=Symbiodinium natans TaxID=878477 RepID=A0A812TT17_9DINO|nr:unnamed protein product [Symbiodinium natans]
MAEDRDSLLSLLLPYRSSSEVSAESLYAILGHQHRAERLHLDDMFSAATPPRCMTAGNDAKHGKPLSSSTSKEYVLCHHSEQLWPVSMSEAAWWNINDDQ